MSGFPRWADRRRLLTALAAVAAALIAFSGVSGCTSFGYGRVITGGLFLDRLKGTIYNDILRREVDHEVTIRKVGEASVLLVVSDSIRSKVLTYTLHPENRELVMACVSKYLEWEAKAIRRGDMLNKEICHVFSPPYLKFGDEWSDTFGTGFDLAFVSASPRRHRLVARFTRARSTKNEFIVYKPDDFYMDKSTAIRFRELLTPAAWAERMAEVHKQRALEDEYR